MLVTSAVRPIPASWRDLSSLYLAVSIDGLQPEHDRRRAPATYDRILKHIAGHRINSTARSPGRLFSGRVTCEEFASFWSERKGVRKIWFSLYTPQEGEVSEERLTPHDRAKVLEELRRLRQIFPLIEMPDRVLKGFQALPIHPKNAFSRRRRLVFLPISPPPSPPASLAGVPYAPSAAVLLPPDSPRSENTSWGDWFRLARFSRSPGNSVSAWPDNPPDHGDCGRNSLPPVPQSTPKNDIFAPGLAKSKERRAWPAESISTFTPSLAQYCGTTWLRVTYE